MITFQATRKWSRNIHIIAALYNLGFIYTPLHGWQYGLTVVQWGTFPLLCLTGFWLMKGHRLWLHLKYGVVPFRWKQMRRRVAFFT